MGVMNFENNIEELERIISDLEKGDKNLEDSITEFEKGVKLSKDCNKILEESEKKITKLLEEDGNVIEEDFETEETK